MFATEVRELLATISVVLLEVCLWLVWLTVSSYRKSEQSSYQMRAILVETLVLVVVVPTVALAVAQLGVLSPTSSVVAPIITLAGMDAVAAYGYWEMKRATSCE